MNLPVQAMLREVGPRDGFQSINNFVPTDHKLAVIDSVRAAGITEIEATSFVSPKAVPQLRDAAELMEQVRRNGTAYTALVPNLRGAENAIAANVDRLAVVISASEAHNQANVRRAINDSLADLDAIYDLAYPHGVDVIGSVAVSFGCPYEGDIALRDVFKIVQAYLQRGSKSIIIADTTGMATPNRVAALVHDFQRHFGGVQMILHFHNNRGTAMANLLAALDAGATCFDTALGGIGGCPYVPQAAGNLPTEDVVYMLEEMGVHTGVDLENIIQAAQQLQRFLGFNLPGQVMKSGPRDPQRAAHLCDFCTH